MDQRLKNYSRVIKKTARNRYLKRAPKSGKKSLNYKQLYTDVMLLKSMVNAEKKEIATYQSAQIAVGQINVNTDSGYFGQDITPNPAQGSSDGQRNGDSIKLHSMLIKGQLIQQTNSVLPMLITFYVISVNGSPETVNINNFLTQNPLTLCTDHNSLRNKDRYKNYTVIRKKTYSMRCDQYSGQGNFFKDFMIPLKFKSRHVNYLSGTTNVSNGQLILYVVCNSGNVGATNSTSTTIPVTGSLTGCSMKYTCDAWYYDN